MACVSVMACAGVAAAVFGVVALLGGQPYGVWYPLLLAGPVCALVFGALIPVVRLGYAARERQKMAAMDA